MFAFMDTRTSNPEWVHIVDDLKSNFWIMDIIDNDIIAQTDRNSPFKKIVRIDTDNPDEENWETIIEGTKNQVLSYVNFVGGKFFAHFTENVTSVWKVYNVKGEFLYDVKLPGKGIVNGFEGKKDQFITWYSFNNSVSSGLPFVYFFTGSFTAIGTL